MENHVDNGTSFKPMNYCEESLVIDVIVLFCQEEQLGKVGTRVPISI